MIILNLPADELGISLIIILPVLGIISRSGTAHVITRHDRWDGLRRFLFQDWRDGWAGFTLGWLLLLPTADAGPGTGK